MPMLDITVPRGKFAKEEPENLTAQLTDLIIEWEGGTEAPGYDKASWAFVQEADLIAADGRHAGRQVYRVVASVPKGSLDERRRRRLMRDVAAAVIAADGAEPVEAGLACVWCIVHEVPDGNWEAGASPMKLRDLAQRFGVNPGSERRGERRFDQR
jgi:phenylpyruvate tautomerase PptA (4-oxalocrotonate tautomerase family)